MKYELIKTDEFSVIKYTNSEGIIFWIPVDERNSDYQDYLAWKYEQK